MYYVPTVATACVMGLLVLGCDEKVERARVWRASDHDQPVQSNESEDGRPRRLDAQTPSVSSIASDVPSPHRNDGSGAAKAMRAWATNCIRCHGRIGMGDGPEGPTTGATDFSRLEWQRSVTNEQIALAIRNGKGKMSGFPFEPKIMDELVQLLRRMAPSSAPDNVPPLPNSPQTASSNSAGSP